MTHSSCPKFARPLTPSDLGLDAPSFGAVYLAGGVLNFQHTQINPQNGQSYPIFNLPKRETLILVSGYSAPSEVQGGTCEQ